MGQQPTNPIYTNTPFLHPPAPHSGTPCAWVYVGVCGVWVGVVGVGGAEVCCAEVPVTYLQMDPSNVVEYSIQDCSRTLNSAHLPATMTLDSFILVYLWVLRAVFLQCVFSGSGVCCECSK